MTNTPFSAWDEPADGQWRPNKRENPMPVGTDQASDELCDDCPPVGYETDRTRCLPCPRRARREAAPAKEVGASHAIIVDIKHQIERLDLADEAAREDAAETIIVQVETLISRINAAEQRVADLEREREEARVILAAWDINSLPNDMPLKAICEARVADLQKQFDLANKYKWQVRDTCTRAEAAESQLEAAALRERAHLRLKNELVLKAYPAMDAIDAIRAWCDGQKYANDTITVSRLSDMLPPRATLADTAGG